MANITWSLASITYLQNNAGSMTDEKLAVELSLILARPISVASVRKKRQRLKLQKTGGRGVTTLKRDAGKNISPVNCVTPKVVE